MWLNFLKVSMKEMTYLFFLVNEGALVFLFFTLNHSNFSMTVQNTEKLKIRETRE